MVLCILNENDNYYSIKSILIGILTQADLHRF